MAKNLTTEELARVESTYPDKKGGKQIAGVHIRKEHGKKRLFKYVFADGSEAREDEDGKQLAEWPKKKLKREAQK